MKNPPSTILIVEDDAIIAGHLRTSLTKLGYDILGITPTGEQAVQKAGRLRPGLVLMDIHLAGEMNGIEAAAQIRAEFDIPALYLTAHTEGALLQQAKITEPYGYLVKPVRDRELYAAIEMALYKRAMEAKLKESEERFRAMVENSTDLFVIVEADGTVRYQSPAIQYILGYSPDEQMGEDVFELIHPDDLPQAQALFARLLQSPNTTGQLEARFRHQDGSWRVLQVVSRNLLDNPAIGGVVVNARDVTEHKQANKAIEHRMEQLTALSQASQIVNASLELDQVLTEVVSLADHVVASDYTGVILVDQAGQPDQSTESTSNIPSLTYRIRDEGLTDWIIRSHKPAIGEIDKSGAISPTLDEKGPRFANPRIVKTGARSFAGLPMIVKNRLLGVLYLYSLQSGAFRRDQLPLLTTFANQAAIAIENARLYEQVQRHTKELERRVADRAQDLSILYEVTAIAGQVLDLETALTRALDHVLLVMQNTIGEIHILGEIGVPSGGDARYLIVHQNIPAAMAAQMEMMPPDHGLVSWVLEHGESLLVPDISVDPRAPDIPGPPALSYIGVPIRVREQMLGALGIFKEQPPFSMEEITLITSIADHVGIVIESARLRQRVEQTAVREERERLARELYDSITQLLYGLTLFAKWAKSLCEEGDLEAASERVIRIGETAQQALKEMRLLVYELRPELLEQDGLVGALQRRLDAVEKRSGVEVSLHAESPVVLPAPVEEGLYRIAQKALNNTLKHAAASQVAVRVEADDERVVLEIEDNGSGFALDGMVYEGGLGLTSMRDRVKKLGGALTIHSKPEEGTTVRVTIETSAQEWSRGLDEQIFTKV